MTTLILVNGNSVMNDDEKATREHIRAALNKVSCIDKLTGATVQDYLKKSGLTAATVEATKKSGKASDVYEIFEIETDKDGKEKSREPISKYTRENLMNRILVALNANTITGEIFTGTKTDTTAGKEKATVTTLD